MTNYEKPLIVDLDGTLIDSDLLHETFWSAISKNWLVFFGLFKFLHNKAKLKSYLVKNSKINVATLPFNQDILTFVREYRNNGGKTVLATASHEKLAEKISCHLGVFDEFFGSNSSINLKGRNKAKFLKERFGYKCFHYIGDSKSDIHVWKNTDMAITVNASRVLRKKVESLNSHFKHFNKKKYLLKNSLKALRPHQWIKNILVFLPMLAAHEVNITNFGNAIFAFFAFCFVASSVYVTNDLVDLDGDRKHPRKKNRPIPSGKIPIAIAPFLGIFFAIAGFLISLTTNSKFLILIATYYIITLMYSFALKRIPLVDIFTLAILYTIRIIGGGAATGVELSFWLLAFSVAIFLSLAATKRNAELIDLSKRETKNTKARGYHIDDISIINSISISAGYAAVLISALYVNSPEVIKLYNYPFAIWGVCAVLLYWLTRIFFITNRGKMHDDPIVYAAKDIQSYVCFFVIISMLLFGAFL